MGILNNGFIVINQLVAA